MSSKAKTAAALIAFATGLGACAANPELLFESPCPAPCWYGVVPGRTTREELRQLIPSFPYVERSEAEWWSDPQHVPSSVSITSQDGSAEVTISTDGDTVASIRIQRIGHPWLPWGMGFELQDAISLFGAPESVILGIGCGGDFYCHALYLVYPHIGTIVAAETSAEPSNLPVPPTLRVTSVGFVESTQVDQYLAAENLGYSVGCLRDHLSAPWSGYGVLHFSGDIASCAE
jgi:hypothetical protein